MFLPHAYVDLMVKNLSSRVKLSGLELCFCHLLPV